LSEKIKFNILKHAGESTPYNAGSTIFTSGEPADSMFVVTRGEVDIMADGKVIDHLTDGEVFGEMSLIDKVPRSADAVASTDCEIIKIDEARFLYMTENTPMFALKVMRIITSRLRDRMADLKELRGE
jgi:CRP-like cAMP-binding protein